MSSDAITVFIVDDQPLFRLGLKTALSQGKGLSVMGEATPSEEAVDLIAGFQPNVVLVGTSPPRNRGMDVCRRISQRCPGMAIIVMTPAEDSQEMFDAIKCGAWGYISKLADASAISQVIDKVSHGDMPLQESMSAHPAVARRLLEEFQAMARNPRLTNVMAPLSPREMEMLQQLGNGRSNKEIAHVLGITPQTVKNHVTAIFRKLDVNDRTQAVLAGLRYGWITLEDSAPQTSDVTSNPRVRA